MKFYTIQKIIDRGSAALSGPYEKIADTARREPCNYIDETSWWQGNALQWLWVMVNERVAFYRIDPHRSKEAFQSLIDDWNGILVSDGYGVYKKWVNARQTCLAHLIRTADGLAERKKTDIRRFGKVMAARLRELTHFAKAPADPKQWEAFYRHLLFILSLYEEDPNDAGKLARRIIRQFDSLWTFLEHQGVSQPITAPSEPCALRFCGANAAWAPKTIKEIAGCNAFNHSKKPVGCETKPPSPCWWISCETTSPVANRTCPGFDPTIVT